MLHIKTGIYNQTDTSSSGQGEKEADILGLCTDKRPSEFLKLCRWIVTFHTDVKKWLNLFICPGALKCFRAPIYEPSTKMHLTKFVSSLLSSENQQTLQFGIKIEEKAQMLYCNFLNSSSLAGGLTSALGITLQKNPEGTEVFMSELTRLAIDKTLTTTISISSANIRLRGYIV